MPNKRSALGRGLDALISMDDAPARDSSAINEISLDQISPNPEQPRVDFDDDALDELASSIRELGIIQPLSLRKIGPEAYQIIAGERRFRAARLAGLTSVPAYIRTADDAMLTEMALIENIQRQDLNAIEIALTFKKLIDRFELTQENLSKRIGKKRATIANFLRLLRLPAEVQLGLRDGHIDMGHARALLSLDSPALQLKVYNQILAKNLSVRRVEELVKKLQQQATDAAAATQAPASRYTPEDLGLLKRHLSAAFKTPVQFTCNAAGRGKIAFQFDNEDQMQRLLALFDRIKAAEPQA